MKQLVRVVLVGSGVIALAGASLTPSSAATEPVQTALAAPTSLSPDDSASPYPHVVRKSVVLDWADVRGANGYRVQVGRDSSWSDTPVLSLDVRTSRAALPVSLPHATYVWRVAALSDGKPGHWSSEEGLQQSEAEFTRGWRDAPAPIAPIGARTAMPEYAWSPVPDAAKYQLQVSAKPFSDPATASPDTSPAPQTQIAAIADDLLVECITVRTRVTLFMEQLAHGEVPPGACSTDELVPTDGTTVYWRVRAVDVGGGGATTDGSTDAGSDGLAQDPPFGTASIETCPSDDCGNWSAVTPFSITIPEPGTLSKGLVTTTSAASDPDGLCAVSATGGFAEHAVCVDVPTIRWQPVSGATGYRVTLALDDELSNIQRIVDTRGTSWTPTDSWAEAGPGTAWYYVVQACDSGGCGPVTSTPPSFRKVTPRQVTSATAVPVSKDFRLSWSSLAALYRAETGKAETQDASLYHLQIARSSDAAYEAPVRDVKTPFTFVDLLDEIGDGAFRWRVQPIDSAGHKLPWSSSRTFTRDVTPPRAAVSASSSAGILAPIKVTFSEPVSGVSGSTLSLSPSAPATVSVTGPTSATLRPTRPLVPGQTYRVVLGSAIKDSAGNSALAFGPTLTASKAVDDGSKALVYGGTWASRSASNALGGTFHSATPTTSSVRTATLRFNGTGAVVYGCLGPKNGYLDVYVDGVRKAHVSTYRSYSGCGEKLAQIGSLTKAQHVLQVRAPGTKASASKGTSIGLDAITVSG